MGISNNKSITKIIFLLLFTLSIFLIKTTYASSTTDEKLIHLRTSINNILENQPIDDSILKNLRTEILSFFYNIEEEEQDNYIQEIDILLKMVVSYTPLWKYYDTTVIDVPGDGHCWLYAQTLATFAKFKERSDPALIKIIALIREKAIYINHFNELTNDIKLRISEEQLNKAETFLYQFIELPNEIEQAQALKNQTDDVLNLFTIFRKIIAYGRLSLEPKLRNLENGWKVAYQGINDETNSLYIEPISENAYGSIVDQKLLATELQFPAVLIVNANNLYKLEVIDNNIHGTTNYNSQRLRELPKNLTTPLIIVDDGVDHCTLRKQRTH